MHTIFWLENLKGRDHLEDLGVDGRIIFEWILRKYGGRMELDAAQDRDQWWDLVKSVMNLRFP
jgi:hypothetical protein